MAGVARTVLDNYSSGREDFSKRKSAKRVSFLEDDMVVIIPNNDEDLENSKVFTSIPRCRIPGPNQLSSSPSSTAAGLIRVGPSGSIKSQTQRRFPRAGDQGRSKEKQVKSILKKSSTESCLQNSRFHDSFRGDYGISNDGPSTKYKVGVVQLEKPNIKTKLTSSFYVKNEESEGSESYSDFLRRQRRGNTESPQPSIGPCFYKTNFSPNKSFVQRHGSFNVARPLNSTTPEEQHRKSEILSKQSPRSSTFHNCKNDALGVVGSMLNISDLYPVLNTLQRNSLSSSDSSLSKYPGTGGRYVSARELIARKKTGNNAQYTRNNTQNSSSALRSSNNLTQSNVSARTSSGLGRAAELSLLNRLRKFEKNEPPYLAWQTSERSIHSSPHATSIPKRTSTLTSVYGGSYGGRMTTVLDKTSSALRSPSSQYYY